MNRRRTCGRSIHFILVESDFSTWFSIAFASDWLPAGTGIAVFHFAGFPWPVMAFNSPKPDDGVEK
jgi:hypothetical protein